MGSRLWSQPAGKAANFLHGGWIQLILNMRFLWRARGALVA